VDLIPINKSSPPQLTFAPEEDEEEEEEEEEESKKIFI